MSSSQLELTRALHSDIEKFHQAISYELRNRAKTQKNKIYQNHYINQKLEAIVERSKKLVQIYDDANGARKEELDSMTGDDLMKTLHAFDTRLGEIREYHRRFPDASPVVEIQFNPETDFSLTKEAPVQFSGEEGYGRYVDLHQFYLKYINMKQFEKVDYFTFLSQFYKFHEIKRGSKNEQYKKYLEELLNYLEDFYKRTQPFSDLKAILAESDTEFSKKWEEGTILGWEPQQATTQQQQDQQQQQQGADGEKENGGGSKKPSRKKKRRDAFARSIALLESRIARIVDMMSDVLEATRIQVEKKQARTWEENQAEVEREETIAEEEKEKLLSHEADKSEENKEEEEEEKIWNPLNLPLGWDGKPIPYWLYKLHGLGLQFKCEICANYTYYGPRAFERHFQEWRHAHGMRCLRIPNTRHFHGVTKIADAVARK
eukprot:GEZU01022663.1.p1 GENE.GEZU01022663.1~~GEZU01022663.1.p1  ORF type:complete len:432 (+),score=143.30 GEZU01022663.1:55-1350(+)